MTTPDPAPGGAGPRRLPDLWAPLAPGAEVTFDKLVAAWHLSVDPAQDRPVQAEAREVERRLREAFTAQEHHLVSTAFYAPRAGCALTEKREGGWGRGIVRTVHTVLATPSPDLAGPLLEMHESGAELLRKANAVFANRWSRRAARELQDASVTVYAAMTRVAHLSRTPAGDPQLAERTSAAAGTLDRATRHVETAVRREVGFTYLVGTLAGALATLAACGLLGALSATFWREVIAPAGFVGAIVFGALGAVASVFQRVSAGKVLLSYTPAHGWVRGLGMLRPVVGATFGAVAYFALVGGVLGSVAEATGETAAFGLAAVTGFAAGFTERFVADIVGRVRATARPDPDPDGSPH